MSTGNYDCTIIDGVMISTFEDLQESRPRYYAWVGADSDHDKATHTRVYREESSAIRQAINIAKRNATERRRGIEAAKTA